ELVSIPQLRSKLERAKVTFPVVVPGGRKSALQVQLRTVSLADIQILQGVMSGVVDWCTALGHKFRAKGGTGVDIKDHTVEWIPGWRGEVGGSISVVFRAGACDGKIVGQSPAIPDVLPSGH